jgi:hypothetical protein
MPRLWFVTHTLVEDSASPSSSYHSIRLVMIAAIDWDMLISRVCRPVSINEYRADVHQEVLYGPQRRFN